jgi:hypothetical protein
LDLFIGWGGHFAQLMVTLQVVLHLLKTSCDAMLEHMSPHLGFLGFGLAVLLFYAVELFMTDVWVSIQPEQSFGVPQNHVKRFNYLVYANYHQLLIFLTVAT